MDKQLIISISREFGSGGHEIADKIAKALSIPLVDRNLLDDMAAAKGYNASLLQQYDEKPIKMFMSRTVRNYSNSIEENIAHLEFEYIREMADEGKSFVIVGRCSEEVLKNHPNAITVFVLGDKDAKTERVMNVYSLDRDKALDKMKRHDKNRKAYHNNHASGKWGDSRNYEICINSSKLGVDGTVDILLNYIRARHADMK
jgi:cytidylate kinase